MSYPTYIFIVCFLKINIAVAPVYKNYFIVRNVGQGQWTTYVTYDSCLHFDFGGEFFMSKYLNSKFRKQCGYKTNVLFLTHADWDHYSFLPLILRSSKKVCWGYRSIDALKPDLENLNIPFCSKQEPFNQGRAKILFYSPQEKNKNTRSIVLLFQSFLIPGDSPIQMEKKWIDRLSAEQTKYLILGHHGSRSSTGNKLLSHLKKMDLAIVSARSKKYNHPHPATVSRLKRSRIPLLKTEDWGDITIY